MYMYLVTVKFYDEDERKNEVESVIVCARSYSDAVDQATRYFGEDATLDLRAMCLTDNDSKSNPILCVAEVDENESTMTITLPSYR